MRIADVLRQLRCHAVDAAVTPGDSASFLDSAHRDAAGLPHCIYLSGGTHECSRRSVALLQPAVILRWRDGVTTLQLGEKTLQEEADPFALLAAMREGLQSSDFDVLPPALGGYVGYEAARAIEQLPASTRDELRLPQLLFVWPTRMLTLSAASIHETTLHWQLGKETLAVLPASGRTGQEDAGEGLNSAFSPGSEDDTTAGREDGTTAGSDDGTTAGIAYRAAAVGKIESSARREDETAEGKDSRDETPDVRRSFTREEYEEAVRRVRRHIYEGDVYQVNLSQRFVFPLRESAFALWRRLFAANPAPFYAYVDAGDHQVVSTSMERLFLIERDEHGETIETRPIKGTRPRGATAEDDARWERELCESEKDAAELSMIVDLARNDVGRVSRAGSVRVREHRRVERYTNVMHLVSVVEGRLRGDADIAEVFRALFPGGSITGCPKIRAMEIIDDIEPVARHAYTGSVGLLEADGRADFNIAIRTAVVRDGLCHLSVGGGIVYDSDPAGEYEETLHKGETFFRLANIDIDPEE